MAQEDPLTTDRNCERVFYAEGAQCSGPIRIAATGINFDNRLCWPICPAAHLTGNIDLSPTQLRQAQAMVEAHVKEIENAWRRHFGS